VFQGDEGAVWCLEREEVDDIFGRVRWSLGMGRAALCYWVHSKALRSPTYFDPSAASVLLVGISLFRNDFSSQFGLVSCLKRHLSRGAHSHRLDVRTIKFSKSNS
jgi:hypothetical protein